MPAEEIELRQREPSPSPPPLPRSPRSDPNPPAISSTTTLIFFVILILAFFPSIFHFLWSVPLHLFFGGSDSSSSNPAYPDSYYSGNPGNVQIMWFQKQFSLPSRARGSYLITDEVLRELPQIKDYKIGLLNLFIQHTSCALSLNENWDSDVRKDMSDALDRIVPEAGPKGEALYRHDAEGPDDLPAHVKSALIGASVTIPIKDGKLGIWHLEFRTAKHTRRVVATIQGEKIEPPSAYLMSKDKTPKLYPSHEFHNPERRLEY